jgi:hypothetical protein
MEISAYFGWKTEKPVKVTRQPKAEVSKPAGDAGYRLDTEPFHFSRPRELGGRETLTGRDG